MKVLLIDDEDFILNLLKEVVEMTGHTPVTAGKASEAEEVFSADPDIKTVFCDYTLPDNDGLALSTKLRSLRADSVIYLLTGWCHSYFDDKDITAINKIITKPFDIQQIMALLADG